MAADPLSLHSLVLDRSQLSLRQCCCWNASIHTNYCSREDFGAEASDRHCRHLAVQVKLLEEAKVGRVWLDLGLVELLAIRHHVGDSDQNPARGHRFEVLQTLVPATGDRRISSYG